MGKTLSGDFHLHTFLSDGTSAPNEIFSLAKSADLSHIAITDHDFLPSKDYYNSFEMEYDIINLRAVEISSMDETRHRRVHILCYLPVHTDEIEQLCNNTVKNRMLAGLEMAGLVSKKHPVSVEEMKEIAKNSKSIFKQHIMQALIDQGITDRIYGRVFEELFNGKTGSCLVNCKQPNVLQVIDIVKKSGGICVMAHPHTYKGIDFLKEALANNLLDGVEVWSGKTTPEQEEELVAITKDYDIIKTGGTDFHGKNGQKSFSVGHKQTSQNSILKMMELHEKRKAERIL